MRGYEVLGAAARHAESTTARLSNACLEAYNDELTDMFARLHSTNPETHQRDEEAYEAYKRNFAYKQDADYQGYQRFAFEKQSEMEQFVKYANRSGVETVYVPVKLGGRYYVEISESVVLDNPKTHEQYKASAQAFAEKFSQETGYAKPTMNWKEDTYQAFKEKQYSDKTMVQREIEQSLLEDADLAAAKRKAQAVILELDYYRSKYDPDTALKSATTYNYKTGQREYDPNTGTGLGRHNADALSTFNEEVGVKVIHGSGGQTLVIKDGSIVTDAAMIARVTAADTARREAAAVVDGKLHDRGDFHLSETQKRMQINSAHIIASHTQVYYGETRGGGRYSAGHLDSFRDRLGGEQAIMSHLETKVLIDKDAVDTLTAYTESRSYGKFERTGLKHAEFTARQMETLAKLQAMAAGTVATMAGDTALANTTFKNGGKEVITLTAEDRINLYEMTRKVGYEMRNDLLPADVKLTDAQKASLQSAENSARPFGHNHKEYNLPSDVFFGEEKLTAFRTNAALAQDLGIDLRHELKQGRTLTLREMQNFTDLGTMRALADMGVTYNQAEGRFFRNGKALNREEFNCWIDSLTRKEIKEYFAGESAISRGIAGGRLGDHFGEGDKGASKFFHQTGENYGFKMDETGKVIHFRTKMETTHYDILNIDKAFLTKMAMSVDKNGKKIESINLLTKSGKIDVKALKALTPEQLKAHGISKETFSAFYELHIDGRGKRIEIGKLKSGALLIAPFTRAGMKMLGKTGDQETGQFVNDMHTLSSGVTHIREAHNAIIQADQRRREVRDMKRASKINSGDAKKGKGLGDDVKTKKPSKKVKKEQDYLAKKGAADTKAIEKFVKKEEHQAAMVASSKKRTEVMRRLNLKQRAAEKFAQTKVGGAVTKLSKAVSKFIAGALGTVAAMAGLLVLLLWGILVLVIVVIMVIQSLTSLPFKGLKALAGAWASLTGEEPAVVELMKICNDREDEWLDGLQDYEEVFDNRKELMYTLNYVSYEDYIASNPSLVILDDTLYIDPFHGSGTAESHREVLTPVTKFAGANNLDLVTNPSVYNQKDISTDGNIIAVESGHTSNVKDILAMTDCMYQFDIQGSGDDSLQSIMNEPPAVINFENFYNKTIGTIKFVANVIGTAAKNFWNWLTGGDDSEEYPSIDDYWGGTVKFGTIQNYVENLFAASHQEQFQFAVDYPTYANSIVINGVTVDISDMPQEIASELGYCVEPVTNNFYLGYDSSLSSVSRIYPCLADGTNLAAVNALNVNDIRLTMSEYAGTEEGKCVWEGMDSNENTYNRIKTHGCWVIGVNSNDADITYTAYSDWKTSESDAKSEAQTRATSNASGFTPDTNTYSLSADHNNMTIRVWQSAWSVSNTICETKTVDDPDTTESTGEEDNPDTPEDESTRTVHHSHTEYKAKSVITVGHYHNEGYSRTCLGNHPFCYSGGVVSCQAKGVVYSTTNEQLAMTGMYQNESLAPRALDFELRDRGYSDFKGCHIKQNIDYSTPLSASTTGGTVSPAVDPQGSYVASRGLNLYMDGENLSTDINCRSDVAVYLLRDIFDCDCRLDKGRNVFPWKECDYHYYEGWSADNMFFVCSRVAVDWNDLYEFDIPLEIKEPSLSEEDIEWLMNAIEVEYGGSFTESRRQAIDLILHWVGKGHYSKDHTDHNFLETACHSHTSTITVGGTSYSTSYDGCCTASDAWGFMSYILAAEGKPTTKPTNHYSSYTGLKPADYVFKTLSGDYSNFGCIDNSMLSSPTSFTWVAISEALGEAHREAGCFYIGTFNNDSLFDETGTYTLQNGYVIHKGVPVTVGMDGTVDKGCGTVLLRSEPVSTSNPNDWTDSTNYFWFIDPSLVDYATVKYQSFE